MAKQKRSMYVVQTKSQYNNADDNFIDYLERKDIKYEYLNNINTFIIEAYSSEVTKIKGLKYVRLVAEDNEEEIAKRAQGNSVKKKNRNKEQKNTKEDLGEYRNYGVNMIKAPKLWKKGITGKGVNVAVLDTGIVTSKYLNVAGNISFINNESPTNCIDPDTGSSHGTHVAGIIGARGFKDGVVGIAYDCNLYNVKVMYATGYISPKALLLALQWCVGNNIHVINMSFHYNGTEMGNNMGRAIKKAILTVADKGIIMVSTTGNNNKSRVNEPARIDPVIAVGCVNKYDKIANFSNYGEHIDYVAPGVSIASVGPNNNIVTMTGTSMACPHVTGLIALLLSKDILLGRRMRTLYEIEQLLNKTAVDLGREGYDLIYGHGRVQA